MRNYSIVLSVIGLSFIVFGAVMSFWITDPILAKSTILLHGVLTTVAILLVAKTIPSDAEKADEKNNRYNEYEAVWRKFEDLDDKIRVEITDLNRYVDAECTNLHRRIDDCEVSKKR